MKANDKMNILFSSVTSGKLISTAVEFKDLGA